MKKIKLLELLQKLQKQVYSIMLFLLVFIQVTNAQSLGALEITPAQYALLPRPNWAEIKSYSTKIPAPDGTYGANGVTMLNNPPIGDQGTEGSCVGWAVGYAAMGVLTFPKFQCWDNARRSPSYVYNQIKVTSDCSSGSYPTDGLNLVKNQGDCSWTLMPYINGDCTTQPNVTQRNDAAQNKAVNWAALNPNDVDGIKLALDLGFPVVTAFRVTQAFDQIGATGGIWSTNWGSNRGGHATCIIGYDDVRQQFKVQNQWGSFWGDNGYYWVTYDLVRNNCYQGLYIVYGNNGSTTVDINGQPSFCQSSSSTYSVSNLACNSTVSWSTNNAQVTVTPLTGVSTTVNPNGYIGNVILSATITNSSGTIQIVKPIKIGTVVSDIIGMDPAIYFSAGQYVYLNVDEDALAYNWTIGGGTIIGSSTDQYITVKLDPCFPNQRATNVFSASIDITTSCGTSATYVETTYANCDGGETPEFRVSVSPNPAKGDLNVQIIKDDRLTVLSERNKEVTYEIRNLITNQIVKQWKFTDDQSNRKLNVSKIPKGVYVLIVTKGKYIRSKQIQIN